MFSIYALLLLIIITIRRKGNSTAGSTDVEMYCIGLRDTGMLANIKVEIIYENELEDVCMNKIEDEKKRDRVCWQKY